MGCILTEQEAIFVGLTEELNDYFYKSNYFYYQQSQRNIDKNELSSLVVRGNFLRDAIICEEVSNSIRRTRLRIIITDDVEVQGFDSEHEFETRCTIALDDPQLIEKLTKAVERELYYR